jgi:hypothetical protein
MPVAAARNDDLISELMERLSKSPPYPGPASSDENDVSFKFHCFSFCTAFELSRGIARGAIDGWNLCSKPTKIRGYLAAMMNCVDVKEPEDLTQRLLQ